MSSEQIQGGDRDTEGDENIAVGECPEHEIVTEDDGAVISFPTVAECHCGRELDRATVASRQEVQQYV